MSTLTTNHLGDVSLLRSEEDLEFLAVVKVGQAGDLLDEAVQKPLPVLLDHLVVLSDNLLIRHSRDITPGPSLK